MSKTRVAILGSTGSIGTSALDVARTHADRIEVVAIAAATNVAAMAKQILEFRPRAVAMATADAMDKLTGALGGSPAELSGVGNEGLCQIAAHPDVDIVLCASSGTAALDAVLCAIDAGKTIALANKEVLVMAGGLVMDAARKKGVAILPVDSEHNAIHQCLHGRQTGELRRLILTASGGPFRGKSLAALASVTAADALKHPTWQMGPKITIDSATLMNKGLEVIEAHWLFGVPASQIDVVVHPQSIVHSMAELKDGSIIAGTPSRSRTASGPPSAGWTGPRRPPGPSSRRTGPRSAAWTWPTRPVVRAGLRPPGCRPPTRSRSTRSLRAPSAGPASPS